MAKKKENWLTNELAQLKKEMAPMTFRKKVDHIWTYYKEYIFVFALCLFVVVGLTTSYISSLTKPVITGIAVNVEMDQTGVNYLSTDYAGKLGVKDRLVRLEQTRFTVNYDFMPEQDYNASQIVVLEVSNVMLDYMLLDKSAMEYYTTQEVYLDLNEVFTAEEIQAFEKQGLLIYCQPEGSNERWPAAIKVTDLPFIRDNVKTEGDIYFAVGGTTKKTKEVRVFWDYINAWETK